MARDRDKSRVIFGCLIAATMSSSLFAGYAMMTGNQPLLAELWDATRLTSATLLGWAIGRSV